MGLDNVDQVAAALRASMGVGDELILTFGGLQHGGGGAGNVASQQVSNAPPIAIPPGGSLTVHLNSPSNDATGLSAEFEFGWWER